MNKRTLFLVALSIILTSNKYAGIAGLTQHSRANCANNESITWHLNQYQKLLTVSTHQHYNNGSLTHEHTLMTGWDYTWRSAAVCWLEGLSGWRVWGRHYIQKNYQAYELPGTYATDCSLDRGWWDY